MILGETSLKDFLKEKKLLEIETLSEAIISLNEHVDASLKVFDVPSIILELECNNFMVNSVIAMVQIFFEVCFFDRVSTGDGIFEEHITFNKRRRGSSETEVINKNWRCLRQPQIPMTWWNLLNLLKRSIYKMKQHQIFKKKKH